MNMLMKIEELNSLQDLTYKDDGNKVGELKQQISQKMILLCSTVTFRQCAAK